MALKEFKNLPDTSTPLNAENLNYNFDLMSNMITVRGSGTTSLTTTSESETITIPLNETVANVGDKLTFNNGDDCIVIGAGVSYVSVSCGTAIQLTTSGMTYQNLIIYKNSTQLSIVAQIKTLQSSDIRPYVNMSDILVPVSQGDKISLKLFNRLAGSINVSGQYLTVKVIA